MLHWIDGLAVHEEAEMQVRERAAFRDRGVADRADLFARIDLFSFAHGDAAVKVCVETQAVVRVLDRDDCAERVVLVYLLDRASKRGLDLRTLCLCVIKK